MVINNSNNVTLIGKEVLKPIDEAKRKLQESIVTLNRGRKNSQVVNILRKVILQISYVQEDLERG